MNLNFLQRAALFLVLLLVQALILNHIHLLGYATPLLYIYFVISFKRGYPKWGILLWSFCLGLSVDIFSNTPGLAAATMTLVGLIQPYLLELFVNRDDAEDYQPAIATMGLRSYSFFASMLTLAYCLIFFTLEAFSFFNWLDWILNIVASTILSIILILVIDNLRK